MTKVRVKDMGVLPVVAEFKGKSIPIVDTEGKYYVLDLDAYEEYIKKVCIDAAGSGGGAVTSVNGKTGIVVLSASDVNAYTKEEIEAKHYLTFIPSEYITESELMQKGFITEIPSEYVTDTELGQKGYITEIPAEYVTETGLAAKGFITEIPSEYVTESELMLKGYITEHQDISGKLDESVYNAEKANFATKGELAAKADGMKVVESAAASLTINANTYYRWGEMAELTIMLAPAEKISDEYVIQFKSGQTPTTLSLPETVKWVGGKAITIEGNKTYLISIVNNLAVGGAF